MNTLKLSMGQWIVLGITSAPMAAVGVAGAVATYINMDNVLHRSASALGLVAAGEGATLICALVALAVTLMGQHTPAAVRLGMWLVPLATSGVGIALAPSGGEAVVMGFTPLAMTAAGEGVAFVARRVVAYRTGVDIEQQRRSGLLLWHANRAANGSGLGKKISKAAVWRLTKQFAATDGQMSVQLSEVQRYRISEGADANLFAVLSSTADKAPVPPSAARSALPAPPVPAETPKALSAPLMGSELVHITDSLDEFKGQPVGNDEGLPDWMKEALADEEARVAADPTVPLMTTAEVASLKNVKPSTVRSWKHRGHLRVHDVVDGVPMYHPLDVANLD